MKLKLFALSILSLGLTMTAFASMQASTCCQDKAACCDKAAACCDQSKCCDKGASCCKKSPKPTCCDGKDASTSPAAATKL